MNKRKKTKILLVEDDANLRTILIDYLEMSAYEISVAVDGEEGFRTFSSGNYDLCILDVMMPRMDGFTLAREIRQLDKAIPIIFLTAKGLKDDRIEGFKAGCDDYVTKPFSSEELSLRIEAILKRCSFSKENPMAGKEEIYSLGNYTFNFTNQHLQHKKFEKSLTRKEAALLRLLCINKGKLMPREKALISIWGDDDYFIGRSMDVFISKLRKYLSHDPRISISNIHGAGFRLEVEE